VNGCCKTKEPVYSIFAQIAVGKGRGNLEVTQVGLCFLTVLVCSDNINHCFFLLHSMLTYFVFNKSCR